MIQKIKMQDYCIDVDYGGHVVDRLRTRFDNIGTCYLDFILENIFSDEKVADFLINDVRVGEDVVVIDEDSGISFAMNIGTECFFVKTIFNAYEGKLLIGEMQKVLRYAKSAGLRVEVFRKCEVASYA